MLSLPFYVPLILIVILIVAFWIIVRGKSDSAAKTVP